MDIIKIFFGFLVITNLRCGNMVGDNQSFSYNKYSKLPKNIKKKLLKFRHFLKLEHYSGGDEMNLISCITLQHLFIAYRDLQLDLSSALHSLHPFQLTMPIIFVLLQNQNKERVQVTLYILQRIDRLCCLHVTVWVNSFIIMLYKNFDIIFIT